jgi:Uma2 family endonuclease
METDASFEGVSLPEHKRATYADLEALPENVIGQIIEGELFALPRPTATHVLAATKFMLLAGHKGLDSAGGWLFAVEPELHLGEDVLVPDMAGWRAPSLPDTELAYFTLAPAWICEVLSPSTARLDRERKLPIYARAKVGHAWLLDPKTRTLEVFRLRASGWEPAGTFPADAPVRAEPFDTVELDLGRLWVRSREPVR